jgi:hypothetical protein
MRRSALLPIPVLPVLVVLLIAAGCSGGTDELESSAGVPTVTGTQTPTEEVSTETATPGEVTPGEVTPNDSVAPLYDPDSPAFTEESTISTVGLDEVFFGMTADAAAEAAGTAWVAEPAENSECWLAAPINGPEGVQLMMWENTVERIDVTTAEITTRSGAGVGSTPDELRTLFGDRLDESDPARLLFVPADEEDAEFRIVFEIVDGSVASYRAGRLPMVEMQGCT